MIDFQMSAYLVLIEKAEYNFGAWAPDLPGCVAVGDTREDCESKMREAIEFHIEGLRLSGEQVPRPQTTAALISVKDDSAA